MALQLSDQINNPYDPDLGWRIVAGIFSFGISEAGYQSAENAWNDYVTDVGLLEQYENTLNTISGDIQASQDIILSNQWKLQDLAHDKAESEDFLEDYRQMLAGEAAGNER